MAKKYEAIKYHDMRSDTYRLTAHYLFDLGYPVETVAKIVCMSEEYVRAVERLEARYRV